MSFLKSILLEKEAKYNRPKYNSGGGFCNDEYVQQSHEDHKDTIFVQNIKVEQTVSDDDDLNEDVQIQPSSSTKQTSQTTNFTNNKTVNKIVAPQQIDSVHLMENLSNDQENQRTPHPVDAFLAGIAPTLKSLSPYYLNLTKSEIFASVQKHEMEMLLSEHKRGGEPSNSSTASTSQLTPQ